MATYELRGKSHSKGSWTGWFREGGEGEMFDPNLQCNYMVDNQGWQHNLLATADEDDPDKNHVHIKFRSSKQGFELVTCSLVDNGEREHSRRAMIENINRVTSLSIPWR